SGGVSSAMSFLAQALTPCAEPLLDPFPDQLTSSATWGSSGTAAGANSFTALDSGHANQRRDSIDKFATFTPFGAIGADQRHDDPEQPYQGHVREHRASSGDNEANTPAGRPLSAESEALDFGMATAGVPMAEVTRPADVSAVLAPSSMLSPFATDFA